MAKRKLMPPTQELVVNQGDDFSFQLRIKDSHDAPVDITDYQFTLKVREDAESDQVLIEAVSTLLNAPDGLVEFSFPSELTSKIDTEGLNYEEVGEYWYDILQTNKKGKKTRILQGRFIVSPGISYH